VTIGMPSSLTDRQIEQIIRYRAGGKPYKEVARLVGCSPDQAIHYWRTSSRYRPQARRAASAKAREARKPPTPMQITRSQAAERKKLAAAQEVIRLRMVAAAMALRAEIAKAVAESRTAPRYKPGDLSW
jgi:DNA-binding CsgD family transcriptional regulator